jgi:CHASE2 domain-containing sensor protein
MDRHITEGCTNVIVEPDLSITKYPVSLHAADRQVYSLPALMTRALTGKDVVADKDGQHTINYRGISFPVVDYRDLADSASLISGHKVLIGSTREETDMHLTPLGRRSGLEVLAFTLNSMIEGDHVWWGGPFWVFIVAVLGGAVMNVIDYYVTRPIHHARPTWVRFLAESEIYAKVLAFLWMVVFTGITYAFYAYGHLFVDTWLALATIAFIEEGRLIYKAVLTVLKARFGDKAVAHSVYADDIN